MAGLALVVGSEEPALSIAVGLTARGWDVHRSETGVDPAVSEWRRLDLVVHAAYPEASRRRAELLDLTAADWHAACDEPLEGAIRLAQAVHAPLAAAGGTIVFLVPLMASAGGAGFTAFAGAAEGVRLLAKSLAKTWGVDGIRAHAITLDPGAFLDPADAAGMAEANALHDPPLGRVPDLETEVARVVLALASDDLASLTGASLVVDGGLWMPG